MNWDHGKLEMDLQQMRYAVAVAETRNFTRAAERCHVVQSALSHGVASLEREVGVRLFERTNRRVEMTQSGTAFVAVAREVLAGAERARAAALAAAGELTGHLVVGTVPNLTALDVHASLRAFRDEYPGVTLRVVSRSSEVMYQSVVQRELDVAFVGMPIGVVMRGVHDHELVAEDLELVVWPGHRLTRRRGVRLADLAEEEFVDFPSGSFARQETDDAFDQAGVARRVLVEVENAEAFRAAVGARLGIGMLPQDLATGATGLPRVRIVDAPRRTQRMIWAKPPSPAALALIGRIRPFPRSAGDSSVPS